MKFAVHSYDKDFSQRLLESLAEERGSIVGETIMAHATDGTPLMDTAGEQGTLKLLPCT